MFKMKTLIYIVLAGIVGTIANAVAAAIIVSPEKLNFIYDLSRYGIAIFLALLIPVIYRIMPSALSRFLVSVLALTLGASLLAKLYFGVGAPWLLVLSLNLVYAVVTTTIYVGLSKKFSPDK
ncbi:MAG: hypothetical protein COA43_04745 [Robiginitomaculum sp.]|nr:MAG: hypothetical protein COA43_04745 [Robiginitomaculum sp.]